MRTITTALAVGAIAASAPAFAQSNAFNGLEPYAAVSAGVALLGDSDNAGEFSAEFETGAGAGLTLPPGTPVGWTTEFENGFALSGALGARRGVLRGEVELAYQTNDVDTHAGVFAADLPLDGADAGVLITGSDPIGVTVGDLVADGQGSVETIYLFANGYYDIALQGSPVGLYVGAGIGAGFVDVDYSPSATPIIDDSATVAAFQGMVGASFPLSDRVETFAGYRYRMTSDAEVDVSLFPATLDIENQSHILEAGVRFRF